MKLAIRLLFMRLTTPKIGLRFGVQTKYYNSVFLSAICRLSFVICRLSFVICRLSFVICRLSLVIVHRPTCHLTNDKRQMTMAPPLLPHARSKEGEKCL